MIFKKHGRTFALLSGPDLAFLYRCAKTPGVESSAIVLRMHIKPRLPIPSRSRDGEGGPVLHRRNEIKSGSNWRESKGSASLRAVGPMGRRLRLNSIPIWIFGMNNDRINKVDPRDMKQSNMTYAK